MKIKLIALVIAGLLAGCNDDSPTLPLDPSIPTNPDVSDPNAGEGELPDIGVPDPIIPAALSLDGHINFGASVICNGEPANQFNVEQKGDVSCSINGMNIATFNAPFEADSNIKRAVNIETLLIKNAEEYKNSPNKAENVQTLIKNMGVIQGKTVELEFANTRDELTFENYLTSSLDMKPDDFKVLITEKVSNDNQADKVPTTHVPDIEPAVTPGASSDLNQSFVSANAESALEYKPTEVILATGKLVDSQGRPVNGIAYFSKNSRGVTGFKDGQPADDGTFEFSWGDVVSFGIETFELGEVRGNKNEFKLTDLGAGNEGMNAEKLVLRYSIDNGTTLSLKEKATQIFAQYPNVVNEAISLSLSSENTLLETGGGQTQVVPGEFTAQFNQGLAAEIDQAIGTSNEVQFAFVMPREVSAIDPESSRIQADVKRLWGATSEAGWEPVERFHIFHDSTNFYGSTGSARGQAAVNIANTAFPVMMARNDKNYWIDFGKPKAWDKNGNAYITEAPSKVVPDNVGGDTATFNLPFISVGELGKGKVMVMGNARYNSVLVCPNGYSWNGWVDSNSSVCGQGNDSADMGNFFKNVIRYLTNKEPGTISVATNIPKVYFKRHGQVMGSSADYVLDKGFASDTQQLSNFSGLDPASTPLAIVNGFEYRGNVGLNGPYDYPMRANAEHPKLSQQDVTDLISYVEKGGSVLVMESIMEQADAGEMTRLLDSAGIAFGMGGSVVANGNGPSGGYPDRVRNQRQYGIWVLERYSAVDGGEGEKPSLPYIINEDGTVDWKYILEDKPDDQPKLEMAKWIEKDADGNPVTDKDGNPVTHVAFIDEAQFAIKDDRGNILEDGEGKPVLDVKSLEKEKARILDAFVNSQGGRAYGLCTKPDFHYEVNCLEYRPGNGIPVTGGMFVPAYTELKLGEAEAKSMVAAANLGTNIEALYQHERYFRTKGKQGERLNSVDLNRIYQNMTVWLWNDLDYRYEAGADDELGFKRFTQFLNCYTNDQAGGNTYCSEELKDQLASLNMVYRNDKFTDAGVMNPNYPLNYMEKPLTRLMLGRSFWDLDIKVDIRQFPGEPTSGAGGGTVTLDMSNKTTAWFASNRQPTGQWAQAHVPFTVSVSGEQSPVTITVALADDLTGREKHELGLQRPPRMSKSFVIGGGSPSTETFTVPYGGLVYAQGGNSDNVQLTFSDTLDAPLYINGEWKNDLNAPAPIGEVVSKTFVFTAPKANLRAEGYKGGIFKFAKDLDQFSSDLNDFYARDEGVDGGANRKATGSTNPNSRHHFVNDVVISIGAAHSGYPVMNASFNAQSNQLNTNPLNSWLLWHEVGHNAAEAPFNVDGATEVVNNLLALYMQDLHHGKMSRVEQDIRIAPEFVKAEAGHAWGAGGAGERLVMFAQLKEWAETEFDIGHWYTNDIPAYYSDVEGVKGWNLFKLMHRLSRNDNDGQFTLKGDNQCRATGLGKSDMLMLCASYASQTDLSEFFQAWNPGTKAYVYPGDPVPHYEGGITAEGLNRVKALNLPKPTRNPLTINSITVR